MNSLLNSVLATVPENAEGEADGENDAFARSVESLSRDLSELVALLVEATLALSPPSPPTPVHDQLAAANTRIAELQGALAAAERSARTKRDDDDAHHEA